MQTKTFPKDFIWGAATAAAQIEGAVDADGRGPSIWETFCDIPGNIAHNDNTDLACDFYNRWHSDIELMRQIRLKAFRFSISWSRILPDGLVSSGVNQAGIDYYSSLIDSLLKAGIEPHVTLYHWDLPQALQNRGGWLNRDICHWFSEYAEIISTHFGDRIKHWITFNEPQIFLSFGHSDGSHAPGLKLPHYQTFLAAHHVNLAHGKAVKILRKHSPESKIGIAIATKIGIPADPESAQHIEAARKATINPEWAEDHTTFLNNTWWPHPIIHGRYPEELEQNLPDFAASISSDDMQEISQPIDFLGYNYYFGTIVEPCEYSPIGWRSLPDKTGEARTYIGWPIHPEGLYWGSKFFHDEYNLPLCIYENGLSSLDWVDLEGKVNDYNRIDFLTRYLRNLHRACAEGIPMLGYFHWSLMDNFEWAEGYKERFGLIHVDYQTQKRTLKASAHWYRNVIETNGESIL